MQHTIIGNSTMKTAINPKIVKIREHLKCSSIAGDKHFS